MKAITFSILVVDDDADDRFIIDEAFKKIGYECEVKKFITGDALMHYLEQIEAKLYPSLIVLDNALAAIDALHILADLKNNPNYRDIPVIVHSTSISASKKQALSAMGALACIEKGTVMEEIVAIVKEWKSIAEQARKE